LGALDLDLNPLASVKSLPDVRALHADIVEASVSETNANEGLRVYVDNALAPIASVPVNTPVLIIKPCSHTGYALATDIDMTPAAA
jgi:hypothetical protein